MINTFALIALAASSPVDEMQKLQTLERDFLAHEAKLVQAKTQSKALQVGDLSELLLTERLGLISLYRIIREGHPLRSTSLGQQIQRSKLICGFSLGAGDEPFKSGWIDRPFSSLNLDRFSKRSARREIWSASR